MDREDCWMSFSEALNLYMEAREALEIFGEGRNREGAKKSLQEAKDHMDALTGGSIYTPKLK